MKHFNLTIFQRLSVVILLIGFSILANAQPGLVKDINTEDRQSSNPQNFIEYKGKVYFQAVRERLEGQTLYVTDGTEAGTQQVLNPNTNLPVYAALPMAVCNDLLFFLGTPFNSATTLEPVGSELCAYDGTNFRLVKDINPGITGSFAGNFLAYGNVLLFSASNVLAQSGITLNNELWRSDGTEAGTYLIKDIYPGSNSSSPEFLKLLDNKVVFFAADGVHGREPWITDGTEAGTSLLKDITEGSTGSVQSGPGFEISAVMNNMLYFTAGLGIANQGAELYRTDGTPQGTVLLKNLRTGLGSSPRNYTTIGNRIFFSANVPETGGIRVYVTDGTPDGTTVVPNTLPFVGQTGFIDKFSVFNNRVYFPRSTAAQGEEYWHTNMLGTDDAQLLKDINAGTGSGVAIGGGLLYALPTEGVMFARDNSINSELWRTNGTSEETRAAGEIRPGNSNGAIPSIPQAIVYNGKLIFTAQPSAEIGMELFLYSTPEVDLPLHRIVFNAFLQNMQVHCPWEIDQSENKKLHIALERSNNGSGFVQVADTTINYPDATVKGMLIDINPLIGNNIYRLKIIESNGDVHYTVVRTVHLNQSNFTKIVAAPNPASGSITFTFQGLANNGSNALATITDASGRIVKSVMVQPNLKLDISTWPQGIYYISISGSNIAPLRFIKLK